MKQCSMISALLVMIVLLTFSSAFAAPSTSIPLNQLGAEADKKAPAQGVTMTAEGLKLSAPMQKLEAYIAPKGAIIRSVSQTEGEGDFSINPITVGRSSRMANVPTIGTVSSQDEHSVLLDREIVMEQFSASSDGIRQDFIIAKKPAEKGDLTLSLFIKGAKAQAAGSGIVITIPAGRKFVYGNLKATDAKGKTLDAKMEAVSGRGLRITVEDAGAIYPVMIDPTITDADWESMNSDPFSGTDASGSLNTITYGKGCIYIGGQFAVVGNAFANNIAKWDGSKWSALGSGTNRLINCLLYDSSGNLFAGGNFDTAGGIKAKGIAKWDGKNWNALGPDTGLPAPVSAIACDAKGNLYAAGKFAVLGSLSFPFIAKWNGVKWDTLGSGIISRLTTMDGRIDFLSCDGGGNLYVSGRFDTAGGINVKNVAKWNGVKWDSLGSGTDSVFTAFTCDSKGTLYAVKNSMQGKIIIKWDGKNWITIGNVTGYHTLIFTLFCNGNGNLYVGGFCDTISGIAIGSLGVWNGSSWNAIGTQISGYVYAMAFDAKGTLFVGGSFSRAGNLPIRNIVQWNGATWERIGSGAEVTINALVCDKKGTIYAGGRFDAINGVAAKNIAQWNGSKWSGLGSGTNRDVLALACDSGGNLFVGGYFDTVDGIAIGHVAKWNGASWNGLATGTLGNNVRDFVFDGSGNLYIAGIFSRAGDVPANNVAKWDGANWSALGTGVNNIVFSLACDSAGNLFAGGFFDTAGNIPARYIARWDGKNWNSLGESLSSGINKLFCDHNGKVFVIEKNYLEKWNGTDWDVVFHAIPFGPISSITEDENGMYYFGGNYKNVNGTPINNIAKFDGTNLNALGSGIELPNGMGSVSAIVVSGSTLYAGGEFCKAGNQFANGLAKLNLEGGNPVIYHQQNVISAKIRYRLVQSTLLISNITSRDRISLYSLSGRCIRQAEGVSVMKLSGIAPQPLFVRVSRAGKIISTGMVMVQ